MRRPLKSLYAEMAEDIQARVTTPDPLPILERARGRRRPRGTAVSSERALRFVGFGALAAAVPSVLFLLVAVLPVNLSRETVVANPAQPSLAGPASPAPSWGAPVPLQTTTTAPDVAPTRTRTPEPTPDPVVEPTGDPSGAVGAGQVEVTVFVLSPETKEDGCHKLAPVTRVVDAGDPVRGAVTALLAGPTDQEKAQGATSAFGAGGRPTDAGITIDPAARSVVIDFADLNQLSGPQNPACRDTEIRGPIAMTVWQFDGWKFRLDARGSHDELIDYVDRRGHPR